jgi:hypothetical protein
VSRRDAEPDEQEGLDATGPVRVKNLTGDARGRIVVGVDGSDGADVALRLAVSEAKARRAGWSLSPGGRTSRPTNSGHSSSAERDDREGAGSSTRDGS